MGDHSSPSAARVCTSWPISGITGRSTVSSSSLPSSSSTSSGCAARYFALSSTSMSSSWKSEACRSSSAPSAAALSEHTSSNRSWCGSTDPPSFKRSSSTRVYARLMYARAPSTCAHCTTNFSTHARSEAVVVSLGTHPCRSLSTAITFPSLFVLNSLMCPRLPRRRTCCDRSLATVLNSP